MALFLALALQEPVTVSFDDPLRGQYVEAVKECRAAQEKAAADPEAAEKELGAVLKAHPALALERRVTVYERPNDPKTYNLCPWQYRGQVRLALARLPGAAEAERRRRLAEAVGDLEKSVSERNLSSGPALREARRELWPLVRARLRHDAPEPAAPGEARPLLAALEDPGPVAADLAGEVEKTRASAVARKADASGREFRERRAQRDLEWADRLEACVRDLAPYRDVAAALARFREAAAFRGAFRLKVAVHPFAEKIVLRREGHPVPVPAHATPLAVPGTLEIGAFEIELHHPKWGVRKRPVPAEELRDGKTYVLSGDVEKGVFALTALD